MKDAGVGTITVGVDHETSKMAVEFAEKYPSMLWATVGLHPTDNETEVFDYQKYKELAKNPKVVAVGECGLDYFRNSSVETKNRQKELFQKQIELAIEVGKPLMIHARPSKGSMDAYEDVLDILTANSKKLTANFHFFVGNIEIAQKILDMGGTMSFDGPVTFSHDYDELIKFLPIEAIMCETDAPFAAPAPYRGSASWRTCEPWMVIEIIKKIAEIKGLSVGIVEDAMLKNTKRVFGI